MRYFINAKIITPDEIIEGKAVACENGKIVDITAVVPKTADAEIIDCEGSFLSPGFADIHVHGGGGYSAMGTPEDIVKMCTAHALYGTTSILPTTLAAPVSQLKKCIKNIRWITHRIFFI